MINKNLLFLILSLFWLQATFAQKSALSGQVIDTDTREALVGVNILYGKGLGVVTDINGMFKIQLLPGSYTITFSYVGYESESRTILMTSTPQVLDVGLKIITLSEVLVVGDVAKTRETPVAFSTITPLKLQEQLAGRDIPMLLNSTPGVYASQMGGGDGDARITIRGFSSRNVGVLLDGVPVNDMENGIVYWSNWFGLDAVTRSIQVQRGLGSSKLAIPSVGGTINIITKGLDERRGGTIKQEVGSDGFLNTSIGYNSGKLKNGLGFTVAGSYKRGDGWVEHAWSKAYFLYFKVDKSIGKHLLSFSAYGAPQSHAQRMFNLPAAVYSMKWALDHGVDSADLAGYKPNNWKNNVYTFDHGTRFNQHWGQYNNYTISNYKQYDLEGNPLADTTGGGQFTAVNERVNEYFKPQITLKDFWNVNRKLSISNIAYLSIGRGGGIRAKGNLTVLPNGEMDFQSLRDANSFDPISGKDLNYSTTLLRADAIATLVERKNEHHWLGILSTANYNLTNSITMAGGIDLRYYQGIHYEELYNLMGADYVDDANDHTIDYGPATNFRFDLAMRYKGDKISYFNEGRINWGGLFYQVEYKENDLSAFVNLTTARTGYRRIDRFAVPGEQKTDWKWINGFTAKGGANYNLNRHLSVFVNLGYLNKAPRFTNVFDNTNKLFLEIKSEKVRAVETGIAYKSPGFSLNANAYYTYWLNKPVDNPRTVQVPQYFPDPNNPDSLIAGQSIPLFANINGLGALHKGVEVDFAWMITRKLKLQGILSFGDWRWNSSDTVRISDEYGITVDKKFLNAKGIHVGDAAQFQAGGELRYEPIRYLYVSGSITYFDKYYSNFDPISYDQADDRNKANFDADGNPVDPWRIPSFWLVDVHAGYTMNINDRYKLLFRFNLLNAFNKEYVADADDNSSYIGQSWNTHDTRSAAVYFGMGRRYTLSATFEF